LLQVPRVAQELGVRGSDVHEHAAPAIAEEVADDPLLVVLGLAMRAVRLREPGDFGRDGRRRSMQAESDGGDSYRDQTHLEQPELERLAFHDAPSFASAGAHTETGLPSLDTVRYRPGMADRAWLEHEWRVT
jgi:hypothetical protein